MTGAAIEAASETDRKTRVRLAAAIRATVTAGEPLPISGDALYLRAVQKFSIRDKDGWSWTDGDPKDNRLFILVVDQDRRVIASFYGNKLTEDVKPTGRKYIWWNDAKPVRIPTSQ